MIVFYKAIEKKRKKERKKERRNRVNYFFYTNILFHILITLTQHTVSEYLTILYDLPGVSGDNKFHNYLYKHSIGNLQSLFIYIKKDVFSEV